MSHQAPKCDRGHRVWCMDKPVQYAHGQQEICAWVRLKSKEEQTTADELKSFCLADKELAKFKVPKYIKIVDSIPVSNMGKYLRSACQKEYKAELGI